MTEKTLAQLETELMQAHNALTDARQAAKMASSRETDALNAVNNAQKRLDEHFEKLRSGSLHGTDWHRRTYKGEREAA